MGNISKEEIENLLEETTQFDFPFLASAERKKEILLDNKKYVEKELKLIMGEYYPDNESVKAIWDEAVKYADNQFKTLPENKRLNGFYLQEVMHIYVEKMSESAMLNS